MAASRAEGCPYGQSTRTIVLILVSIAVLVCGTLAGVTVSTKGEVGQLMAQTPTRSEVDQKSQKLEDALNLRIAAQAMAMTNIAESLARVEARQELVLKRLDEISTDVKVHIQGTK